MLNIPDHLQHDIDQAADILKAAGCRECYIHTFSSIQLAAGVDIRTLQARTGHAQASTLVNTYSHTIKTAAEAASDVLDDMLTPKKKEDTA